MPQCHYTQHAKHGRYAVQSHCQRLTAMAKQSSTTARTLNSLLPQIAAGNPRFGADCTSTLQVSDLKTADAALQPVFEASKKLRERKTVKLDDYLVYMRDSKLCELLLSVLRRLPWAEMQQEHAVTQDGLALLSKLLYSLWSLTHAVARVSSSQEAAAYAELITRCPFLSVCKRLLC